MIRLRVALLATSLAVVCFPAASQRSDGHGEAGRHTFAGYWNRAVGTDVWWPVSPGSYDGVPFTREGLSAQQALEENPEENYPAFKCQFNFGLIVSFADLEIVTQPDDRVIMMYPNYEQKLRWIWTDGRSNPERAALRPMFMGYSTGRWEEGENGLTLLVETVGVEPGYLRQDGLPNTANVRITERYWLTNDGQRLALDLTVDDPAYYTRPWKVSMAYERADPPANLHPVCRAELEYHAIGAERN